MFEFINAIIQLGYAIGEPIKAGAELFDENGNLIDRQKAKNSAIIGGLFAPHEALKIRQESGCWWDLSGDCYADWLEDNEKERLRLINEAEARFREQERLRKQKQQLIVMYAGVIIGFFLLLMIINELI